MIEPIPSFGFSISTNQAWCVDGSRFVLSHSARRTLQLLAQIHAARPTETQKSVYWLLSCRSQIREIENRNCTGILSRIVDLTDDPSLRILAIWLVGRCGSSIGTKKLAKFIKSQDRQTRKELARAFRRKAAWTEIRALLKNESDPRIVRLASSSKKRDFDQRLNRYTKSNKIASSNPPIRETAVAEGVDFSHGAPAKSRTFIRIMLERIHRLVHPRSGL